MYLPVVKLTRSLFWATLATVILYLLLPQLIPAWLPLVLGLGFVTGLLYGLLHARYTRRPEWRCPFCGWVPFALNAWKCKECGFVWDSFATDGTCPRCNHQHEETACVRCRRIAPIRRWLAPTDLA